MIKINELHTFNSPFLAAASGLVLTDETFSVIADDEFTLLRFTLDGKTETVQIFPGNLPEEEKERKKVKPDFETMIGFPDQSVLILPSGSKPNRMIGAFVGIDNKVREIKLTNIYSELLKRFPELNIEGSVLFETTVRLFQRGNGSLHQNAIIDIPMMNLFNDTWRGALIRDVQLGTLNDVPLSFTDASFSKGLIWFLAVAERTESTYLDGEFAGAVLGAMDLEGNVHFKEELEIKQKPEGLVVKEKDFYIVTDADDRSKPSKLFHGVLD